MGFSTQADKAAVQNLVAGLSDAVSNMPVDPVQIISAPAPAPDPAIADLQAQLNSLKDEVNVLQTDKAAIQSKLDMAKVAAANLVSSLS